jgi:3-oxoacyl-[acyl-carrier protein] reductase
MDFWERDMEEYSNRVVVVTGGSKGIGRAIALKFAKEEKAHIVIFHYDPDDSDSNQTLKMLREIGVEAKSFKVDVSDKSSVDSTFEKIFSELQKVDVLINNAGITKDTLLIRMSEKDWDSVLNVNLKGIYNCTHAVLRNMIKQKRGWIVNISSVVGQIGNVGQANYAASKAGIMGFTKSVAKEVAIRGIKVNAVAPGFIDTEMTAKIPEKIKAEFLKQIPMGRLGTPEEVAEVVYWLCSKSASYVTGQVIHVNGGMYM